MQTGDFEIFLATAPGLEPVLLDEMRALGFRAPKAVAGGVRIEGRWHDVWRANLQVRGASKVLARVATFKALQFSELERRAGDVAWAELLRPNASFAVEAVCAKSRLYHSGAVAERIAAVISAATGGTVEGDAEVSIRARMDHDVCTLSVDTSGELLHKRGFKAAVNKAPMRENLAALMLRACGYKGREPVVDPMCGSGTFVIEAAEMALGLDPGRERGFAFMKLATFDPERWQQVRDKAREKSAARPQLPEGVRFYGSDRDAGAAAMSVANAARAGVAEVTSFEKRPISALEPPAGPSGLVFANPPYGGRIGEKGELIALYRSLGQVLRQRFTGWRAAIVTNETWLAEATGLPFLPAGAPIQHGGIRVTLYQTAPLEREGR